MPQPNVTRSARARWGGVFASSAAVLAAALALCALRTAPARAQDTGAPPPASSEGEPVTTGWRPRPVRSGTVSLGAGLVYGSLLGPGLGKEFSNGLGLGFNLRYRSGSDAAYGLAFEAHNFAITNRPDSVTAHDKLQFIESTFDYYAFGATRTRMPHYIVVGAGLVQTRITDQDGEKEFPGDGGVFKIGGGIEYWQSRSMTIDFSVRYHGVFLHQKLDHDVEAGLAVNFYTSP
jgi:hypothetical protein